MKVTAVLVLAVALVISASSERPPKRPRTGTDSVFRGVNIGGFLVLESWITPSLFANNSVPDGLGEWQFCEQLGPTVAAQVMNQHWDTWVTQSDIQALAASGITHIRVPVGYWIVDIREGEPFVPGGWAYLERLLQWAKQAGLQAVVDLHGAPGSQNGQDNSGYAGPVDWPTASNINRTVYDLGLIAAKVVALNAQPETLNVVSGIELLNEPRTVAIGGPIEFPLLMNFYENAYAAVRAANFTGDVWVHDGWAYSDPIWDGFMPPPEYYNVYIDTHVYHCFGGDRQQPTPWSNIMYTCLHDGPMISTHTWADWTIVGEWSLAFGPATPLNLTDGLGWLSSFAHAQIETYCPQCTNSSLPSSPGKGYFFWNFKIEQGYDEWNYLEGVNRGWFGDAGLPTTPYAFSCSDMYPFP